MAQQVPTIENPKYPDWAAPYMPGGYNYESLYSQFRTFRANQGRYDIPQTPIDTYGPDQPIIPYEPVGGQDTNDPPQHPIDPLPTGGPPTLYTPTDYAARVRAAVSEFYFSFLGRNLDANGVPYTREGTALDQAGFDFWIGSAMNQLSGGTSISDAINNLRRAFALSGEDLDLYGLQTIQPPNPANPAVVPTPPALPAPPVTFADFLGGLMGSGSAPGAGAQQAGGYIYVPNEATGGGDNTRLIVGLALLGIVITIGVAYYFERRRKG